MAGGVTSGVAAAVENEKKDDEEKDEAPIERPPKTLANAIAGFAARNLKTVPKLNRMAAAADAQITEKAKATCSCFPSSGLPRRKPTYTPPKT